MVLHTPALVESRRNTKEVLLGVPEVRSKHMFAPAEFWISREAVAKELHGVWTKKVKV